MKYSKSQKNYNKTLVKLLDWHEKAVTKFWIKPSVNFNKIQFISSETQFRSIEYTNKTIFLNLI